MPDCCILRYCRRSSNLPPAGIRTDGRETAPQTERHRKAVTPDPLSDEGGLFAQHRQVIFKNLFRGSGSDFLKTKYGPAVLLRELNRFTLLGESEKARRAPVII